MGRSRCDIKIDIKKAFDSVHWGFLLSTLSAMGFPSQFTHWISQCLITPSYSIKINGKLEDFFLGKRGIRQGDPLSPYIFVICMEVLSRILDKAFKEKLIAFHPHCEKIGLTRLCFADNLIILSDASPHSLKGISQVLSQLYLVSGLQASYQKSELFCCMVPMSEQRGLTNLLGLKLGKLPVKYLGVPLIAGKLNDANCQPLVDKITSRIRSWTSKLLTFAGRLQLIDSVLNHMIGYWLQVFILPKSVI